MTQSFAFWDILPRSVCANRGPAATIATAPITIRIVNEIQRIAHPPCDVVIRVLHRRERAKSKPAQRKPVLREKSPAACYGVSPCKQFVSLVKGVSPPQLPCNSHSRKHSSLQDAKLIASASWAMARVRPIVRRA